MLGKVISFVAGTVVGVGSICMLIYVERNKERTRKK